jgi:radical SAM superfamily enzyme YgiQ (UPF0313 family)
MSLPKLILIDLPTFPKGVVSLSIPVLISCLKDKFSIKYFDINIQEFNPINDIEVDTLIVGMKVSSQNSGVAKELTLSIKNKYPYLKVMWGGEFPTLLPDYSLKYADTIVSGLFEPIAIEFSEDLLNCKLKDRYHGKNEERQEMMPIPDFSLLPSFSRYATFMGLPMETSRGCTEHCLFCMVLVMQKKNYYLKPITRIEKELKHLNNKFINIVDYNFGVNKEHVLQVSKLIKKSDALGWMAEMCLELLDDDELLQEMSNSRCRLIYCGLESIEEGVLDSFNKQNTNHIENYERIIRKVQSYGIQVATGLILGTANTTSQTFEKTFQFFQKMGIIYTKLTFLTYNPGTRVHQYMFQKGSYLTNEYEEFDGVRFSFLAEGVDEKVVIDGFEYYIQHFYSAKNILKRAMSANIGWFGKVEFFLFSYCYAEAYKFTLINGFLRRKENFDSLLISPLQKSLVLKSSEKLLFLVRLCRKIF